MIKKVISSIYLFYFSYFPLNRGKVFLSTIITRIFGTFIVKHKDGLYLEILLNSQMDLSYINIFLSKPDIILKEITSLKTGARFLDVGANIGFYSLNASRIIGNSGRVYSFEPSVREYIRLLNNIRINDVKNIIPYNFALCDKQGEFVLSTAKTHTGLNTLNDKNEFDIQTHQLVQGITLDILFSEDKIEFDLVKIDVEGAEFLVLLGMRKLLSERRIKKMVIEITPKYLQSFGHTKENIYQYLEEFGFKSELMLDTWQYDEIFTLEN